MSPGIRAHQGRVLGLGILGLIGVMSRRAFLPCRVESFYGVAECRAVVKECKWFMLSHHNNEVVGRGVHAGKLVLLQSERLTDESLDAVAQRRAPDASSDRDTKAVGRALIGSRVHGDRRAIDACARVHDLLEDAAAAKTLGFAKGEPRLAHDSRSKRRCHVRMSRDRVRIPAMAPVESFTGSGPRSSSSSA